jgi:hypothetical protein
MDVGSVQLSSDLGFSCFLVTDQTNHGVGGII